MAKCEEARRIGDMYWCEVGDNQCTHDGDFNNECESNPAFGEEPEE